MNVVVGTGPGVPVRAARAVAVFGIEDDEWGHRVCAAVVPDRMARTDADRLEHDLRGRAAARLAGYKRPKEYVVVDALPTTATGKVQRRRLAPLLDPAHRETDDGR